MADYQMVLLRVHETASEELFQNWLKATPNYRFEQSSNRADGFGVIVLGLGSIPPFLTQLGGQTVSRSSRDLSLRQRDWVMSADDAIGCFLSRNSEFPKLGYGFRVIFITPGSRDFETRESSGRRGRNQP